MASSVAILVRSGARAQRRLIETAAGYSDSCGAAILRTHPLLHRARFRNFGSRSSYERRQSWAAVSPPPMPSSLKGLVYEAIHEGKVLLAAQYTKHSVRMSLVHSSQE